MKRLVVAVGLLLYWISPAQAQVCGGGASFKSGPYQAGASLSTASDFTIFDVGVGIGSDPWWGQGGLQVSSTTGVDGHAKGFYLNLGGDFVVDSAKRLYVCPIFDFVHSGSPIDLPGFDSSSNQVGFGGSVGYVAKKLDSVMVIPTGGLQFHHQSFSGSTTVGVTTFSSTTSENYATLQLGVGFVFNDRIALVPSFFLPFGLTGGENSFVVAFSYNFGK